MGPIRVSSASRVPRSVCAGQTDGGDDRDTTTEFRKGPPIDRSGWPTRWRSAGVILLHCWSPRVSMTTWRPADTTKAWSVPRQGECG